MKAVNKTLYIPLYGKALVSRQGMILHDPQAEAIWEKEGFQLHGKAKSKWLAYFMAMRSAVVDDWLVEKLRLYPNATVLHLGCGLDSRCERVGARGEWYDIDMEDVIETRKLYFSERDSYRIIAADFAQEGWISAIPTARAALVVMEGISMYLKYADLMGSLLQLRRHFKQLCVIVDVYTELGVKLSGLGNPIRHVGAVASTGIDDPGLLAHDAGLQYTGSLSLTPQEKIAKLPKAEQWVFRSVYASGLARALYRLHTYEQGEV